MRTKNVFLQIAISALFLIVAGAGCSSPEKVTSRIGDHPIYPNSEADTITLEQVLGRSRLAMSDTDSYKTREVSYFRSSTTGLEEPSTGYSELDSNGDFSMGSTYARSSGDSYFDYRKVGTQFFTRSHHHGWEEPHKPNLEIADAQLADRFLEILNADGISLRSTTERSEDGAWVYRLEYTEESGRFANGGYEIVVNSNTVLIDQYTNRIVTVFRDSRHDVYFISEGETITPDTKSRWYESVQTYNYYDYNQPVVIEVPDEYVPWEELVVSN
jgi:hypothetical protein